MFQNFIYVTFFQITVIILRRQCFFWGGGVGVRGVYSPARGQGHGEHDEAEHCTAHPAQDHVGLPSVPDDGHTVIQGPVDYLEAPRQGNGSLHQTQSVNDDAQKKNIPLTLTNNSFVHFF